MIDFYRAVAVVSRVSSKAARVEFLRKSCSWYFKPREPFSQASPDKLPFSFRMNIPIEGLLRNKQQTESE